MARVYSVFILTVTVSCHSFGFGNVAWQLLALVMAKGGRLLAKFATFPSVE
jgi:hypothetical protein